MLETIDDRETYLSDFKELADRDNAPWLGRLRKKGIERFEKLGFPTMRHEEWRFTNLAPLTKIPFRLPEPGGPGQDMPSSVIFTGASSPRLVFINGHSAPGLSALKPLPKGVVVGGMAPWAEEYLGRHARYQDHAFTALNTAFCQQGAAIRIPDGVVLDAPIHLVFISAVPGEPTVSHPRVLIVVGANSRAAIVESYLGRDGDVYLTNAVTEVTAGENAVLDHYKLEQESREAFHIATLQVLQSRGSKFSSHSIALGGSLVRNEINVVFDAEGGECTLNGLYMATGRQLIDNHTVIDHAKPRCASHELYKGILADQARGVFNGKIYVRQDAQKTDAKQTNQTLLLSDDATINTKPQLEIYADDVKCTHGATVGQLDEEALFYLRSRGISRSEARRILTFAFANDIIGRIAIEPMRERLEELLLASQESAGGQGNGRKME